MPQHRHLTNDIAAHITCYEEMIMRYQEVHRILLKTQSQGYGGERFPSPLDQQISTLREQAETFKWKCLNKGYCDIENGWHRRKEK